MKTADSKLRLKMSGATYLQVEEFECDLLNELVRDVLRVEFGAELELQGVLLLHVLLHHLQRERDVYFHVNITRFASNTTTQGFVQKERKVKIY